MAKKIMMRKRPRKAPKKNNEPNILERLKKLSDNAPIVQMRGGSFSFDDGDETIKFKD